MKKNNRDPKSSMNTTSYEQPSPRAQEKIFAKLNGLMEYEDLENMTVTADNSIAKIKDLYRFESALGSGGFGIVVAATERSSELKCSIKVNLVDP